MFCSPFEESCIVSHGWFGNHLNSFDILTITSNLYEDVNSYVDTYSYTLFYGLDFSVWHILDKFTNAALMLLDVNYDIVMWLLCILFVTKLSIWLRTVLDYLYVSNGSNGSKPGWFKTVDEVRAFRSLIRAKQVQLLASWQIHPSLELWQVTMVYGQLYDISASSIGTTLYRLRANPIFVPPIKWDRGELRRFLWQHIMSTKSAVEIISLIGASGSISPKLCTFSYAYFSGVGNVVCHVLNKLILVYWILFAVDKSIDGFCTFFGIHARGPEDPNSKVIWNTFERYFVKCLLHKHSRRAILTGATLKFKIAGMQPEFYKVWSYNFMDIVYLGYP